MFTRPRVCMFYFFFAVIHDIAFDEDLFNNTSTFYVKLQSTKFFSKQNLKSIFLRNTRLLRVQIPVTSTVS